MGAFNLLHTEIECANCLRTYSATLQFKFGVLRQDKYKVNDIVNLLPKEEKLMSNKELKVYGVLGNDKCPFCGFVNKNEYDITIKNGVIIEYKQMIDYSPYLSHEDGSYYFN